MTALSREQRLINVLDAEKKASNRQVELILHHRKSTRLGSILCDLAGHARNRGIQAYFLEGDLEGCKQNFYLSSKLTLASVGLEGGASFEVGRDIQIALLSDSNDAIKAMSSLNFPDLVKARNDPLKNRFHVYMLQMAILGEDEVVSSMIEKIAAHGRNPLREECAAGRDFFSLLLKRDKAALETLIQRKHAGTKGSGIIAEEFMSYLGTLEAKLCWYRDVPVEINHPLVPMDLMPIRPLSRYDDIYDFLKPDWVPASQGFLSKLTKMLGR